MSETTKRTLLLFGGSGAIGTGVAGYFRERGWRVVSVSRSGAESDADATVVWRPEMLAQEAQNRFAAEGAFDAVCWCQGMNFNDRISTVDVEAHLGMYQANVAYILKSLRILLDGDLLRDGSRLCIVSSIWQELSRSNKLSYGVTKSAIKGLVLSLANDLAERNMMVNAVLPGVLDTPMTRANLSPDQIAGFERATGFARLAKVRDVASTIHYLCSPENTGVTAQFIGVDLGFSNVRTV